MKERIPVVDLFAGPGGLGEGFSAFSGRNGGRGDHVFRIAISAEMDPTAHATLRLRAFFRQFDRPDEVPDLYYDYLAGQVGRKALEEHPKFAAQWKRADAEARCLTLGRAEDNRELERVLRADLKGHRPWVLIGGPPCQAYSLVGRARNRGKENYRAEDDHRHFLYREYLQIIREFQPPVFVMENVKGILSSKVEGEMIFRKILADLMDPFEGRRGASSRSKKGYRLFSLRTGRVADRDSGFTDFDPRDFLITSENYGVPQNRHRVFVLGVREDFDVTNSPVLRPHRGNRPETGQVIGHLPPLRSGISAKDTPSAPEDNYEAWVSCVSDGGDRLIKELERRHSDTFLDESYIDTAAEVARAVEQIRARNHELGRVIPLSDDPLYGNEFRDSVPVHLHDWYADRRLQEFPNHETRAHIPTDLCRYLFCAAWGRATKQSPKASDFTEGLRPAHLNWDSGKFADRFRVQLEKEPATTITSHISKDGHYFIHYDPAQCRSLTVREAARIQTFPDNYFFEGPRTSQYVQVGNAVPPWLARQIAGIVWEILKQVA